MAQNDKSFFGSLVDVFGDVAGGLGSKLGGIASQLGVGLINNAMSQDNAREQREWLEKMWAKQNAYNDPSAMADRMRKAGLNPFTMMGAEPAGSAGSGAQATTIPINNPLDALRTIAEVRNLNASVGRTETETDKILAEISMLDIARQRGLLENKEYEERLKYLFEEWSKRNPFTVERENIEADTVFKQAQTFTEDELRDLNKALIISQTNLNDVNADVESSLKPYRQALLSAQTSESKSSAMLKYEQALKTKIDAIIAKNVEKREQRLFPGTVTQQALTTTIMDQARELGATENEIAELDLKLKRLWNDPDSDTTWSDLPTMLVTFLKDNVSLFGGATSTYNAGRGNFSARRIGN